MKTLAFDTSTAEGSVAVLDGERLLSEKEWRREKSHSEFLTAEIESALKDSSLTINDIDLLAVGQGPGSFTGIRVAINAARALSYALSKPVSVFDTTEILAEGVGRFDLPLLAVINAQKNCYYIASFERQNGTWTKIGDTSLASVSEIEAALTRPHLCLGDGCLDVEALLSRSARSHWVREIKASDFPAATNLGRLALTKVSSHPPLVWNAVQPLYIRASGAEEKLREGHQ